MKSNVFETVKYMVVIVDRERKVYICHFLSMDWIELDFKMVVILFMDTFIIILKNKIKFMQKSKIIIPT